MTSLFALSIVILAIASTMMACRLVASWMRQPHFRAGPGLLVFATGTAVSLAPMVATLSGQFRTFRVTTGGLTLVVSASVVRAGTVGLLLLCGVIALVALRASKLVAAPPGSAMLAILLWGAGTAGALSAGLPIFGMRHLLVLAAVTVAAVVRPDARSAVLGAAHFVLSVAVLSATVLAVRGPDGAGFECRVDKCSVTGNLFHGAQLNENALGLLLVLGLPFVAFAYRGAMRVTVLALITAEILATGSRTSLMVMVVVGFVTGFASALRRAGLTGAASLIPRLACVLGLIAQVAVPLYQYEPTSLALRVRQWDLAFETLHTRPVLGNGWNAQAVLYEESRGIAQTSSYSLHNQSLDMLYTSGAVGLALLLLLGYRILRASSVRSRVRNLPSYCLLPVVWAGISERPWSLNSIDWLTWSLVATLIVTRGFERARELPPAVPKAQMLASTSSDGALR